MQKENLTQSILRKVLSFETAHPFVVIGLALALTLLSISYTIKNLDFYTSQKDLISPSNRFVRLSDRIDQFDRLDKFIVTVENKDTSRSIDFIKALVTSLKKDKDKYLEIFYRVDPEAFRPWALLYLDRADLLDIKDNLSEHRDLLRAITESPGLITLLKQINNEMASRMVGELFTGFLNDEGSSNTGKKPMDLGFVIKILRELARWLKGDTTFRSPWGEFVGSSSFDDDESYFWTKDKKYLLLFVTPRKQGSGFIDSQHSLKALRSAIDRLKKTFPDIQVGVTGQEALNMDEMSLALHDMGLATIISIAALIILLTLFWRGLRRPLLEMIELIVALSLTTGLTTCFIGHLNILSITFAPLLLGLGIDYGIHWFARYQEEAALYTASKEEAICSAMVKLGPAILLAGLTAALSFFPLILTGFRGLMELGIITSMGMIMTTLTTLGLLPSLTMVFDKSGPPKKEQVPSKAEVRALLRLNNRSGFLLLLLGLAVTGLSLWRARGVKFDLNMLHLQAKSAESVLWEKKLLAGSKRSSMYGAVLAQTPEEVRQKTKALEALGTVSEIQSVSSLLPEDQEAKIQVLRQLSSFVSDIKLVNKVDDPLRISELDTILGRIRFKMMDTAASKWGADKPLESQMLQVRRLIDDLRRDFRQLKKERVLGVIKQFQQVLFLDFLDKLDLLQTNIHARPMRVDDLPERLKRRFVNNNGSYLLRVFPSGDIWEPSFLGRFVRDLMSVDPDAIGDPVTLYVFTKAFRNACLKAAIYAVVFIFLILLVTSRSLGQTILVMIPLVVGTLWTVGLMPILDIDFNLANSLFLPLIVGAGVEYGIIIIQRWRQMGNMGGNVVLPLSTAKGVILAGLTTTVGFGSLAISDHQGIRSLGLLAVGGSLGILAAAVLFLPAILQFCQNNRQVTRWDES